MAKIAMIQEQVLEGHNELLESAPTVTSSNVNPWTLRVPKELWVLCSGLKRWKLYSISATIQSHVKSSLQLVLYKELLLHGGNPTVMASKPKTMQEAIEFATELMDKNISTLVERQAENKRKLDNNNQAQQQPPKKQGVAITYTAGSGERKESDCPELKNQNHGNQAEGTGARGMVHALGGGETNQDI
ncbi:hypothetical protein Tco_0282292 [Tanacetum coccineum]